MASTNTSVVQRLEMLEEEDGIGEICGGRGGGGENPVRHRKPQLVASRSYAKYIEISGFLLLSLFSKS